MNSLEARLGVTLFERSKKGVRLTKSGEIIYNAAQNIIRESEEAIRLAKKADVGESTPIRIGLGLLINSRFFETLFDPFFSSHPQYSAEFVMMESGPKNLGHYVQNIIQNKIDLFEQVNYPGMYNGNVNFYPLCETEYCIAVPKKHPLYNRDKITLNDLSGEKIIISWSRNNVDSPLNRAKSIFQKYPSIELIENSFVAADITASAKHAGTPILITDIWEDLFPGFRLFHLDWDVKTEYGIIYSLNPAPSVRKFIDDIIKYWEAEKAETRHSNK